MNSAPTILDAAKAGDVDAVRALLDQDAALANSVDNSGMPLLMIAIYYRQPEIIDLLRSRGVEPDIFAAAALGDVARIETLLREQAGLVHEHSPDGWTPLHLAAHFGQQEAARVLLNAGADVTARSTNQNENLPIHAAAAGNQQQLVELLLDHGTDPNAGDGAGFTPLHLAAQNGSLEIVRLLLDHGVSAAAVSQDGRAPTVLAMHEGHQEVANLLQERAAQGG